MNTPQIRIILVLIALLVFSSIWYLNKDDKTNTTEILPNEMINNENILDSLRKSGREWFPVPVMSCEEIFKNQYHVTFENSVTILTNKPAKIGDTTRCWMNNWYQSKLDESIDSLVFEKPY